MMKKLILLFIAGAVSYGVNAQQNGANSVVFKSYDADKSKPVFIEQEVNHGVTSKSNSANKGTGTGGSRWYSSYELVNQGYTGGALASNRYVGLIGWDSTQYQLFNTGPGAVNWLSVANFIDPIFSQGFNSTNYYDGTAIRIRQDNSYTVDSIYFPGAYMIGTSGNPGTIDTLVLSVAALPYNDNSFTTATTPTDKYATVVNYEGVTDNGGVLKVQSLGTADSINRHLGTGTVKSWKVPLSDTLRQAKTSNGQFPTRNYFFEVPGGLQVPAGQGFAISMAFKPGETWTYKDSVQNNHYFMYLYAQSADNTIMPYYYYEYGDHSMSYLMHNAGPNRYGSAVNLEIVNTVDFDKEFIYIDGKVTCSTCWDLGLNSVNSTIYKFNAYPNPAATDITIEYTLYKATEGNITITNAVGQVVNSQKIDAAINGKATFSVSNLTNGVYFYTVSADGEKITRRFVVSH